MALLSGLFGDNDNESSSNTDLIGILDAVGSVDFNNTSASESVDEDGSSESNFDSTSLGADLDIGSLLSSMTDSFSSSSSDSDGGGIF